jgi:hypothetical protein
MRLSEIVERFNEYVHKGMTILSPDAPLKEVVDAVNDVIDELRDEPEYSNLVLEMQYLKAALNPLVAEAEREKS